MEVCWRGGKDSLEKVLMQEMGKGKWAHRTADFELPTWHQDNWLMIIKGASCQITVRKAGKHSAVQSPDSLAMFSKPRIFTRLAALLVMSCIWCKLISSVFPSTSMPLANLTPSCSLCHALKRQTLQHCRDGAQY